MPISSLRPGPNGVPIVLVVEDDPANRVLLRHILEAEGYGVLTADDGESAVRVVATMRPELVLLDIGLPGADGLEVTRRLRGDLRLATLPILLLTLATLPAPAEELDKRSIEVVRYDCTTDTTRREVTLFASHLGEGRGRRPRHEPVAVLPLTGGADPAG